jgi:hypothetical protein
VTVHSNPEPHTERSATPALLLGTGLALASLILVPALAQRLGMGAALTGAVRLALGRVSGSVAGAPASGGESCH